MIEIIPVKPKEFISALNLSRKIIESNSDDKPDGFIALIIACSEKFSKNKNFKKRFSIIARAFMIPRLIEDLRAMPYIKKDKSNPDVILINRVLLDTLAAFPIYRFGKINKQKFFKSLKDGSA